MSKSLLASIIFAAGAFAFFVLALPKLDYIGSARETLKTKQALLEENQAGLKRVEELYGQYEARKSDVDKLVAFLPEQKRVDQVVSSIRQVAEQAGLNLTGLTTAPAAEAGGTGYKKIFVSFDVTGRYPSFVDFLKLLEQNLRLFDVFEIIASPLTGSAAELQNLINFTVKLNAYNLK